MTADQQLEDMIDRFAPDVAAVARGAIAAMTDRFPGAVRLVYDNYNALTVAFAPNEKARQAVLSVALYPRWASLFLVGGQALPDPHGLLEGSGGTMRHIKLTPGLIGDPHVHALIDAAEVGVPVPFPPDGGYTVIKSISAKQRPRR